MTADLDVLRAVQAAADRVIEAVAEPLDGGRVLLVSVTDPATGQRLATGFVNVPPVRHLRPVP
ncbi:hypothetical protein AB0I27_22780 [Streptomyces sp. NPDC050597]|uniref:hypothetical protein n=1 Tax=Streptomyces sp. NPDC050597 TaxID=3157212 RepID=UPI003438C2B0